MTELPAIEYAEAITSIFGYWPSFHDAEVLTMHLDRDGEDGPRDFALSDTLDHVAAIKDPRVGRARRVALLERLGLATRLEQ